MEYILTIDAGTSAFKIMLWEETGRESASYSEELMLDTADGFVEFPVELYWEVTCRGIRRVLELSGISPASVRVVVISSQGETLINLDKEGSPLRKAIVWMDNRSTEEAGILEKEFSREQVFQITGQPEVVPTWPATKILWQKRNEPEVFGSTAKFVLLEDYLIYRLTGEFVGEYSMHSSSLWLDINTKQVWEGMTDFLGIGSGQLPEITDSGQMVGCVCGEASEQTGFARSTVVVTGALDQAAGAIGAGGIGSGICTETTGSALAVCALVDKPLVDLEFGVPCHCHALEDKYYLMAWGQTAGLSLKWFKDVFCIEELLEAERTGRSVYEILTERLSEVPAGSEGLIFLPHLTGAGCPEFNPYAKGVFYGISLNHGKAHFTRSIMESVAYMLKRNANLLENMGLLVDEIRLVGGASRSRLWNQIKADVLQKPVRKMSVSEAASVGVAMIAGLSIGIFRDIQEACDRMVELGEETQPARTNRQVYQDGYEKYVQLYECLVPVFAPRGVACR